MAKVLD
jgi:hypothetical protein